MSVWCVTRGAMAVSSLAPKADAADASGVGMKPLPQGRGLFVPSLAQPLGKC